MSAEEQSWQETDVDAVDKQYEEYQKGKTRIQKPPTGLSTWRILPPRRGARSRTPFLTGTYVHFVKGADGVFLAEGVCPAKTRGESCSVCAAVSQLRRTKVESDVKWAEDLSAKEHVLCNAVRLDIKDPKPELFEPTTTPLKYLMQVLRDKVDGIDFTHPQTGKNVKFERVGSTMTDTRYSARLVERASPLANMKWLDGMLDLDKVYAELPEGLGTRLLGGGAPTSRQVGAAAGPGEAPPPGGSPIDQVEDPATGEWVSQAELERRRRAGK